MLIQVKFAFTRALDVRYEFVLRKSDISSLLKKYFCGRPSELFFRHPARRKQTYYFFWPEDFIWV